MKEERGEYQKHLGRGGKPYSEGHQMMYLAACRLLYNYPGHVLDVGCGIGFGVQELAKANAFAKYVGIDPDEDCIAHCQSLGIANATFHHGAWPDDFDINDTCDAVFCIEVIEHVEPDLCDEFVRSLHRVTGNTLFFSTPNKDTSKHGARSTAAWIALLQRYFFVATTDFQWTTFYLCNPKSRSVVRGRP